MRMLMWQSFIHLIYLLLYSPKIMLATWGKEGSGLANERGGKEEEGRLGWGEGSIEA